MIAYKGFRPGLICRGYQFVMGLNTTEKANCRENGFMRIAQHKAVNTFILICSYCRINGGLYRT